MQVVDRASACFFSVVLKSPIDGLNTTENGFSILVLLMFVGAQGLDHCTSKEIDKIVLQKYELSTKIYMVHFH